MHILRNKKFDSSQNIKERELNILIIVPRDLVSVSYIPPCTVESLGAMTWLEGFKELGLILAFGYAAIFRNAHINS